MVAEGWSRRGFLAAGAASGLLLAGCGAGRDRPRLRAAIVGKGETDMRLLFKAAGIARQDFDIHYSEFQSGHLVVEALNGGSLDYGGMSEIPPIFAAASTIQSFRQIAVLHGDVNNQAVLVPKGSKARSIADLRGKRVGYVRATTSQYFLIRMLEEAGLGWGDITPVAMGVADGAAAFSQGALDAWAIYGFPIQRAIATEGARILRTAYGILSGNYLVCAHADALADAEMSQIIRQYLALVQQAYGWAVANEAEWAGIVARDIGVPRDYVVDQFRRKSDSYELRPVTDAAIASQQQVADLFLAQKLLPKPVDVRPLWDARFNDSIPKRR
ncbi:aliphatic sulfonate ABC transporter substrate-binding protein [Sphingobium sp. 22B]|uniref:ABC transporter substrate-binding protein n=1 Tax=unclassified Sphingobium TaxID=2611147 RepID=UPI00078169A4|nr:MULTISPECIES: ABC transporter substrate-binding protein [unclassified Sphingobium]KXU32264.1 aliphatic sulfonate ABC transporter substrate-binding protein [Sphingobium sp. AM]KYC32158.1 aliphatic sulfonate ABC transporter substrate-binding protein [Sphingobium sp. 22B]OAP33160.1 aliphatic sulfonate ABC transporter substrate-binding protein [Sphingobium sp. 20006FA]